MAEVSSAWPHDLQTLQPDKADCYGGTQHHMVYMLEHVRPSARMLTILPHQSHQSPGNKKLTLTRGDIQDGSVKHTIGAAHWGQLPCAACHGNELGNLQARSGCWSHSYGSYRALEGVGASVARRCWGRPWREWGMHYARPCCRLGPRKSCWERSLHSRQPHNTTNMLVACYKRSQGGAKLHTWRHLENINL